MLVHGPRRIRLYWMAALACSLALVFAACGGGDDDSNGDDATATSGSGASDPTAGPSATSAATETPGDSLPRTFAVGQTFWHSGFKVEVIEGELSATEAGLGRDVRYFLTLSVSYENFGPFDTFFDAPMAVVADGDSYVWDNFGGDNVPSGLSGKSEVRIQVEEGFDPVGAQLIIGGRDDNKATVPLGSEGGELVALEPRDAPVEGTISMELLDLEFSGGELRYDLPGNYREVESGMMALTLNFEATSRKGGNWSIFGTDFALILPGGSAIGVDGADLKNLPGSDEGTLTRGLQLRFLVDDPASGDYTVRFTPGSWFIGDDGVTDATFDFTLD